MKGSLSGEDQTGITGRAAGKHEFQLVVLLDIDGGDHLALLGIEHQQAVVVDAEITAEFGGLSAVFVGPDEFSVILEDERDSAFGAFV